MIVSTYLNWTLVYKIHNKCIYFWFNIFLVFIILKYTFNATLLSIKEIKSNLMKDI